jgi:membrane-bound lytic murein transglycosylase B
MIRYLGRWIIVAAAQAGIDPHFLTLTEKLVQSGYDRDWVQSLFNRTCVTLYPKVLVLRLTVRESKINYGQFLTEKPLTDCRAFLKKNEAVLNQTRDQFQTPPQLVTAILLLETNLGTYQAQFPTLKTLATNAVSADKTVADTAFRSLPDKERKRWTPQTVAQRFSNRSGWFYGELKAFLDYLKQSGQEPCQVHGSYTGAIGFCQFQPSNVKPYGRDGNGDGRVDLFQIEDAAMSIGSYLNHHGWKEGLSPAQRLAVIKTYNNSTPYAQTILDVAARLTP